MQLNCQFFPERLSPCDLLARMLRMRDCACACKFTCMYLRMPAKHGAVPRRRKGKGINDVLDYLVLR